MLIKRVSGNHFFFKNFWGRAVGFAPSALAGDRLRRPPLRGLQPSLVRKAYPCDGAEASYSAPPFSQFLDPPLVLRAIQSLTLHVQTSWQGRQVAVQPEIAHVFAYIFPRHDVCPLFHMHTHDYLSRVSYLIGA